MKKKLYTAINRNLRRRECMYRLWIKCRALCGQTEGVNL
jgi:hypothetical protein